MTPEEARHREISKIMDRLEFENAQMNTELIKQTKGKPDYTLVPIKGLCDAIEEVRQYGKKKYPDPMNWKKVDRIEYWKAFLRHVVKAWMNPEAIDPESGCKHLHHAAFNLACWLELGGKDEQQS